MCTSIHLVLETCSPLLSEGVDDDLESVKIVSMGHGQRYGSTNTHHGFKLLETGFETLQDQFVGSHVLAVSRSAKIRCRV
jgi:hypothetical protein